MTCKIENCCMNILVEVWLAILYRVVNCSLAKVCALKARIDRWLAITSVVCVSIICLPHLLFVTNNLLLVNHRGPESVNLFPGKS